MIRESMFNLSIPTRIHFGRGCLADAVGLEREVFNDKRVLVVTTGRSLYRLGYIETIKQVIDKYAQSVNVFDNVSANPKLSEVKEGVSYGRDNNAELIVGFGGGSAIDAAKAIAAGIGCDEGIDEMFYGKKEPSNKTLPIVAIPSTAGSGSELSKAAIISDDKKKDGIRGTNLFPKVAIVDSFYTESVPEKITIETGFDVFAHAIESYISLKANRFSEDLSLKALDIVSDNLLKLTVDPKDPVARENMSYASMIMGINLGNVGTALPHRLQYPVGVFTGTPHGAGLLSLFPVWVELERTASKDKIENVSEIIRKNTGIEKDSVDTIIGFIERLKIRKTLSELNEGIPLDKSILTDNVSGNLGNDPAYRDRDIIEYIYEKSM